MPQWLSILLPALLTGLLVPSALPADETTGIIYRLLLALGTAMATLLTYSALRRRQRTEALPRMALCAALGALLGGHLLWCLVSWETLPYYEGGYGLLLMPWRGGYTLFGAVFGALLGLWGAARWTKVPFLTLADSAVPGACVLLCLGRVAEAFTGQGIGDEVDIALFQHLPFAVCTWADADWSEWHWAIFLGEAVTALLLLLVYLLRDRREGTEAGRAASHFLTLLCTSQIFWEQLRADDFLRFGFVRVSQLAAIGTLLVLLWLQSRQRWRQMGLRWALLLLASATIIAAEFALDKPHALPWTVVGLVCATVCACVLLYTEHLRRWLMLAIVRIGFCAAIIVSLLLHTPHENAWLCAGIALCCADLAFTVWKRASSQG